MSITMYASTQSFFFNKICFCLKLTVSTQAEKQENILNSQTLIVSSFTKILVINKCDVISTNFSLFAFSTPFLWCALHDIMTGMILFCQRLNSYLWLNERRKTTSTKFFRAVIQGWPKFTQFLFPLLQYVKEPFECSQRQGIYLTK